MKNENLIPSLLVEDEDMEALPKRGGNYVTDKEKEQRQIEENYRVLENEISSLRCDCYEEPDCNC